VIPKKKNLEKDSAHSSQTPHGFISKLIAQLPARMGGLGLASAEGTADAQRAGNLALTAKIVADILGDEFDPQSKGKTALPELYVLLHEDKVKAANPGLSAPIWELWEKQLSKGAAIFNAAAHAPALERILKLIPDPEQKAYLLSGGEDGAAWLLSYRTRLLTDPEIQALLRARILAPPTERTPLPGQCARCSPGRETGNGIHALECQGANQGRDCAFNNKTRRHALVKRALMHAINGIIAKEKPPGMDRVKPEEPLAVAHWRVKEGGNEGLRADLLLPRAAPMGMANILRAAPILVDVGITHPSTKRVGMIAATAEGAGASADAMEKGKFRHYDNNFVVPVGGLLPVIMETGGRLSKNTRRSLSAYIRHDILGMGEEQEWTYGLITRYNVYWRDLIDAMVIALVKEVAGTLLWNTDHRGPGHLRAPIDGVGHSSSEAMDEEPQVPFGA
jgi:hypothetical protein